MSTQPTIYARVVKGRVVPMTLAQYLESGPIGRVARITVTRGRK